MKLNLIIFFQLLFFNFLVAQTYEKDWVVIIKKIDESKPVSIKELENFEIKYKKQFDNYPNNSVNFYGLLANEYFKENNILKANEYYVLSFEYSKKGADTSLIYISELNLAEFYYSQNYFVQAEKFYNACLFGLSQIYGANSKDYTQYFSNYTSLLIDLGKYEQAQPNIDGLLYYYKTLDGENNLKYVRLLNQKAIILQNLGKYDDAIVIFKGIVDEKRALKLGDTAGYVLSIQNLGDVYREYGKFDLAIYNLNQAKQFNQTYKLKDRETIATIDNNLGLCYKSYGDNKNAEICYNNSISIYKSLNLTDTEPFCSVLSNKADLLRGLQRFGEASELLLTSLDIRKTRFGIQSENYANATANLALVYFDAGYYNEAKEKFLEAYDTYKKTVGEKHQGYANILNCLSVCYLNSKDYKTAESYKLQALQIIENAVGKNHYRYAAYLISTCQLYIKTNNLIRAETNLKEALYLIERNFSKKHELYINSQFLLAGLYSIQQKFEEATPYYFESLDYYTNLLNDYFDAMSEENQMQYLSIVTPVFESYNIFLINFKLNFPSKNFSEYTTRALRFQIQLKSLLANKSSQILKEVSASNDSDLKKIYSDWLLVKNELINNYKSTNQAAFDNNELYKKATELEVKLKSKLKTFVKPPPITFEIIKQNLANNEAILEIFKTSEIISDSTFQIKYGVLVITKNNTQPELIIFKNGHDLEKVHFETYFKNIDEQKIDTNSYNNFFKPFEKSLTDVSKIYVSADGIFHKLNFLSLYNAKTKKYLVDDFEIYPTSNISTIISKQIATKKKNNTASLFGYPDYDYDLKNSKTSSINIQQVASRYGLTNLSKLPGTKVEVEEINNLLKNKNYNVSLFIEQFASEANLRKIKSPTILHIATHGYFLKDIENNDKLLLGFESSNLKDFSLLRSGIILAGVGPATNDSLNVDSENDGILTAAEACLLNLSGTELVILSACQTGLGDEMGAEGVAGLQRSFAIAGAKNIIMSLWPVDDYATQLLMTEFYKNYAATNNIQTSFKLAQLGVKLKYPHPYFWSAFVLLKTFN